MIDPNLAWATYLGGSGDDGGQGIAVDAAGNAFVTGITASLDFAGANNSYHGGNDDAFVAKITSGGSLAWATYLGGSGSDVGYGIAVDGAGNALVTGWTNSSDFAGADNSNHGGMDAFVAEVTTGGSLSWATYLGGTGDEDVSGGGIAVDGAGNAFVTGTTASSDFAGANNSYYGNGDAFVAKIDVSGLTVTINQAAGQADPTNGSPINFTVVFSEAVTDFTAGDVTLGGTAGATTAVVTNPSGDQRPTTWPSAA